MACLAAMTALAWLYLFLPEMPMPPMGMAGMDMAGMDMSGMEMPGMDMDPRAWSLRDLAVLFAMWLVMMIAMMAPSAAPMVLAFQSLNESRAAASRPLVPTGVFLLAYLAVWAGYSAVATLVQWRLHEAALLSPAMALSNPVWSGAILLAAGIFQWTPLKRACLQGCRSPLSFLMSGWREGTGGAFALGLRHGSYCLGCCWILMALLFVAGVMNLLWVAAIAVFVLAEKALPRGEWLGRAAGVVLAAAGVARMAELW